MGPRWLIYPILSYPILSRQSGTGINEKNIEFGFVGIEHTTGSRLETLLIKMHSLVKRGMVRRDPHKMG